MEGRSGEAEIPVERVGDDLDVVALALHHQGRELQALRSGRWKLHFPHDYRSLESAGAGGKPGEYVNKSIGLSLFDLESDPGETVDLADRNPEVVRRLRKLAESARENAEALRLEERSDRLARCIEKLPLRDRELLPRRTR